MPIVKDAQGKRWKVKDATGVEGILIHADGKWYFRVYSENKTDFTDYKIINEDLQVIIKGSAAFYSDKNKGYLDYSPGILGYKLVGEES